MQCLYCPAPGDSLEHALQAAFGEFRDAPVLTDRLCKPCNNRLGKLDEQFTRCGPEAFFRRYYGITGRETHGQVNVFERGSAGGQRIDFRATDKVLGIEVALELDNGGMVRQLRHIAFVELSGKTHHLPIPERGTPEQLLAKFNQLGAVRPFKEIRVFYAPEEKDWVEPLIQAAWPDVKFGEGMTGSSLYERASGKVELTTAYFRAVAKMGFHYFLTQFPEYSGHEEMFSGIRQFIDSDADVDQVNQFMGIRQHPLLGAMLVPGVQPNGWRAHVLAAVIVPNACVAYVQTFVTGDWPAPIYAVFLARETGIDDSRSRGHLFVYYGNGPVGKFAGDALPLETTWADWTPPPLAPAILSA
jgi:hypothetical protein